MKLLKVGDKVPEFSAMNQYSNEIKFSDFKGEKVVIFFYPRANTPGCTAQACDLRDHYSDLKSAGFNLLGVSADSIKHQLSFSNKFDFPFSLLADQDRKIINIFGVWGLKKFRGNEYEGINRITFIINENGIVEKVIEKVTTKDHASQIL
tara:strand:+ start:363 stop:812 length:450 start_codon:yes stop_codon:yes gene_type:complete